MRVRFIRPWAHYSPGQEIDPPDGQAELMIQRGWCEAVVETVPPQEKPIPKPQKGSK